MNSAAIPPFIHQLEIRTRRQLEGFAGGSHQSLFRGQGLEFAELRAYQPGDDLRHLDPSASARSGVPQVRLYQEERNRSILLLTDLSRSCTPGMRQTMIESVALLAFAAVQQRDRVGLIAFSDRVEWIDRPASGSRQARKILHKLLDKQPLGTGTDLTLPLIACDRLLQKPSLVIIISDHHAPLPQTRLSRLAARHELLSLVLRDPAERQLSGRGLLQVTDAESNRAITLDLASSSTIQAGWDHLDSQLQTTLRRTGIAHLMLQAQSSPALQILNFFRQRRGTL